MTKFLDIFENQTKLGTKIYAPDYLDKGIFPIVDQSRKLICGYRNDPIGLYSDVPFIIFGDVTRTIKYIDFPCFLGADGSVILKVKNKNDNTKYLYYYLQNQYIPNAGYNRHYKYLKDLYFKEENIERQKNIVEVLDKLNELIAKCKKKLTYYDELTKSRVIEMFGDPVLNSKKYETIELCSLGYFNRGRSQHRPRNDSILLGGPYPLIQTGEIANADTYINTYEQTYSEEGLKQSKMWPKGTLCITIAANIAKTAILNIDACFPDSIIGLIPSENVTAIFLHNWFKFFQPILEEQAPAAAQKNLNGTTLGKVQVILPPINEQNKFDNFVELIDKSKFIVQKQIDLLQELLDKKLNEYFS